MTFSNTPRLRGYLAKDHAELSAQSSFVLNDAMFEQRLKQLRVQGDLTDEESLHAMAAFTCLTHEQPVLAVPSIAKREPRPALANGLSIRQLRPWFIAILVLLGILIASTLAKAQNNNSAIVVANCGTPPTVFPSAGSRAPLVVDTNGNLCSGTIQTASSATGVAVSVYATSSAASTNSTSVKASAGNLYWIHATNTTATIYYLRLYNASSAPTCSSATNFIETIPILNTGGFVRATAQPSAYTTGIGFCITGGGGGNDNTSAATGVYLTLGYK